MRTIYQFLLLTLFVIISFCSHAQENEWAPVGAKWHYDYTNSWMIDGYALYEVEKDTTVLGKEVKKISVFKQAYNYGSENLFSYYDESIITYKEEDVIYILNENNTAYDTIAMFNTEIGTSWRLSRQGCEEEAGEEDEPLWISIQDTGTAYVGDCMTRWILINYGENGGSDTIYENYGTTYYAFNHLAYYCPLMDAPETVNLRCYIDSNCTYTRTEGPCDDVFTSIHELENKGVDFSIYPNPTTNNLFIDFDITIQDGGIRLYGIEGKLIQQKRIAHTSFMEMSLVDIPAGVYILSIQFQDELISKKIIKH